MSDRLIAVYFVRISPAAVAARAQALAVEQSVEMPVAAIADPRVRAETVGRVESIRELGGERFELRISLSADSVGDDPGQLLNMLFGNSSLHEDLELVDLELPAARAARFGGPTVGIDGLRARVGAGVRALTCSALKPLGADVASLARLAGQLASGGLDYLKDDHGLADQPTAPFAERVAACAEAVRRANQRSGGATRYVPSLTGSLDALRAQARLAIANGIDTVLLAPMVSGLPALQALRRDFPALAIIAHPALAGAGRIAPPLLLGKLFRLCGADATIFPNHGGRFGYSAATCRAIAEAARRDWLGLRPGLPVPAGGMAVDRVGEMLDAYGRDVMLLIGGGLLTAGEQLVARTRAFTEAVARHGH